MPMINRRRLLGTAMAAGAMAAGVRAIGGGAAEPILLSPGPARFDLTRRGMTEGMMGFTPDGLPPVIRLRQGVPADIVVENRLEEITTIHWHGMRLPVDQDGVPWLTQLPIGAGETYRYSFTPPDAGTYWYHPHCNTLEQIARGLAGVIVVEEAEPQPFDADLALQIRDFRLGGDGQFIELYKPRNMARGGTLGTVSTVNWQVAPVLTAPAGGLVRLRLAVTDVTRVYELSLSGAAAALIALDGQPLPAPEVLPVPLILAPGQRADLAVVMPEEGREVLLGFTKTSGKSELLATVRATGASLGRSLDRLAPLPPNPTPLPDLAGAERLDFTFGWSPDGTAPDTGGFCGDVPYRFWSINRVPYAGDAPPDPARPGRPLAALKQGHSYVLRMRNETQNDHPIHLHGLAMHLLGPDGRLSGRVQDTVLLRSHESAEVAVLADNPGDWVFHCHVIEHQKSGLAGFVRVL
ncbi:multicopper oxidase family protein [Frigidibacter sp. RF13]|nr:multicopper oxidase family protein [Frigidibacter sp. RF13]